MYVHSGPVLGMVKVSSWRYIESLILESFIKLNKNSAEVDIAPASGKVNRP